jgi:hypothetical protein
VGKNSSRTRRTSFWSPTLTEVDLQVDTTFVVEERLTASSFTESSTRDVGCDKFLLWKSLASMRH